MEGDINKVGERKIDFKNPENTYTYFLSAWVVYNDILERFSKIIKVVGPKEKAKENKNKKESCQNKTKKRQTEKKNSSKS
jgi:hypothetical protein